MIPAMFPPAQVWPADELVPFDTAFRPATIRRVVDADTVDLLVDAGFDIRGYAIRVRLTGASWLTTNRKIGFNAWETRGKERTKGLAAKDRALDLIHVGDKVRFRSWKGGSRGSMNRWLGLIMVWCRRTSSGLERAGHLDWPEDQCGWYSLADILLHEGHGREWWRGWSSGRPRPSTD